MKQLRLREVPRGPRSHSPGVSLDQPNPSPLPPPQSHSVPPPADPHFPLWSSSAHLTVWPQISDIMNYTGWPCLSRCFLKVFLGLSLFFFCIFRAAPMAYGGSQARGPIRAIAAGLHQSHSNMGLEPRLRPTAQLMAMLDP